MKDGSCIGVILNCCNYGFKEIEEIQQHGFKVSHLLLKAIFAMGGVYSMTDFFWGGIVLEPTWGREPVKLTNTAVMSSRFFSPEH